MRIVAEITTLLVVTAVVRFFVLPRLFDDLPMYGDGDTCIACREVDSHHEVVSCKRTFWGALRPRNDLPGANYPDKIFGVFTRDWVVVSDLYILAGFALTASFAYLFLRAACAADSGDGVGFCLHFCRALFAFAGPGHLYLASYWSVPLAIWLALCVGVIWEKATCASKDRRGCGDSRAVAIGLRPSITPLRMFSYLDGWRRQR